MVKELFLVAGEITYKLAGEEQKKRLNTVAGRPINRAIIKGEDLIYVTNALIHNFHEFMEKAGYAKEAYSIEDCVILSITNMGVQEADEFMPPEDVEDSAKTDVQQ